MNFSRKAAEIRTHFPELSAKAPELSLISRLNFSVNVAKMLTHFPKLFTKVRLNLS
jgi:hypothetical protein